ncbi:MAG: ATP-binding cassette domain-containing protein [Bacilli bacterium]
MEPVLQAKGIQKYYGSVCAIEHIDFAIYPGEVVALLGDNGAGKSTFIKILSGVVRQNHGQILIDGKPVQFASPMEARRFGVETVYQDLALAPDLDVTANIFLGRELLRSGLLGRFGFLDKRKMRGEVSGRLDQLKVSIQSVAQIVSELSGGQRQAVSIVRAASWGRKLVIMDEPTAALGVEESAKVLDLIKQVKERGIPVLLVTHTLPYAFDVADRIVVLRLGRSVAELKADETDINEVVQWITGSKTVDRIAELQGHRG